MLDCVLYYFEKEIFVSMQWCTDSVFNVAENIHSSFNINCFSSVANENLPTLIKAIQTLIIAVDDKDGRNNGCFWSTYRKIRGAYSSQYHAAATYITASHFLLFSNYSCFKYFARFRDGDSVVSSTITAWKR